MALKSYKPRSCGMRFRVSQVRTHLSKEKPVAHLTIAKNGNAGRNNQGRITVRHRGGGVRRRFRIVDFLRDKVGIPAKVAAICYDPNRTANLALLNYADGEKRYILAPEGLAVGATVVSGPDAEPIVGNALPLEKIPLSMEIHNIELVAGKGAQMARSAGTSCTLMARANGVATLRMPSGEIRLVSSACLATIGVVGEGDWSGVKLGKAGRKRLMGIRPTVRGVAMNPVDHPMGGGEGRTSGGSHPRSPWGKLAKGGKTRNRRKNSNRFIVKRRK
ncbi:MAG: 50S ribosomal protein L2 [Kiritimatiellia bacterium]